MSWLRRKAAPKTARAAKRTSNTASNTIFGTGAAKGRRRLQAAEIYSKMHYEDRIRPAVAERLKTLAASGLAVNAAERLEVVKSITRDVFEDESEEVKARIAAEVAAQQGPIGGGEQERIRTPQDYQEWVVSSPY
jgi:hypothetical protein